MRTVHFRQSTLAQPTEGRPGPNDDDDDDDKSDNDDDVWSTVHKSDSRSSNTTAASLPVDLLHLSLCSHVPLQRGLHKNKTCSWTEIFSSISVCD